MLKAAIAASTDALICRMASDDVSKNGGMRGAEAWQDYADAAASEVVEL